MANGTPNPAACGLDKRKAMLFVMLVAIAIACVLVLVYSLMHARPHTDPAIQNTPHMTSRLAEPPSQRDRTVRS